MAFETGVILPEWLQTLAALPLLQPLAYVLAPDLMILIHLLKAPTLLPLFALLVGLISLTSSSLLYAMGRLGGRPMLDRHFSLAKVAQMERIVSRYGFISLIAGSFLPISYRALVVATGTLRQPPLQFAAGLVIGQTGKFLLMAALLLHYRESFESIMPYAMTMGTLVIVLAFGIPALFALGRQYLTRRSAST